MLQVGIIDRPIFKGGNLSLFFRIFQRAGFGDGAELERGQRFRCPLRIRQLCRQAIGEYRVYLAVFQSLEAKYRTLTLSSEPISRLFSRS